MAEGESAEKHLLGMNELCDRLAAMELPVPEEFQPLMILASLPASYTAIVQTLGSQQGKLDITRVTSTVKMAAKMITSPVLQLREDGTFQQGMPRSTEAAEPSSASPSRRNEAEI